MKAPNWTAEEDALIARVYPTDGPRAVALELPHRTRAAIAKRAAAIGAKNRPVWSKSQDMRLTMLWGGGYRLPAIARQIGRPVNAVYRRALHLGLGLGCPNGYEFLTEAARRAGFHVSTMRMILEWAGVLLRVSLSDPTKKFKTRRHIVEIDAVDDAVERWLKTETLEQAARTRHIDDEALRAMLVRAGVIPDRKRTRRTWWRIPSAEIDRVVKQERLARTARQVRKFVNTLEAA